MSAALLFTPWSMREVVARNRVAISPMQMYSAQDGHASDWHLAHLARFALGGAGIVFVESTAVEKRGRNTHGDIGLWDDSQVEPLARIARALRSNGAVPGIQLGHCGRKAGLQKWWEGHGPLTADDAARGEGPWPTVGPSPLAVDAGWRVPQAPDTQGVERIVQAWAEAAARARDAGFQALEIHGAHGYLIHQFLHPLSNQREDRYGIKRWTFALEVAEAVRRQWPQELPLFWRTSLADPMDGGFEADESIAFARALRERGVDVLDCSSGGGISGYPANEKRAPRGLDFRAELAQQIRAATGIAVMGVGLIIDPRHAEEFLARGQADLIALGREALYNPNWAAHAELALGASDNYARWPLQYRMWLQRRAAVADPVRASAQARTPA
ncbi:MAG: NADH:flavin oxidoreductase/NADH oxidase [Rhodoferax sp.]|jgi:2,4-dienoyl-CoA reductase-like NADH-dependent reductase (Old Yellow Enzyme family)|nr:NADH:flavin oxidoreductase/NADH oxidase [Rhodoferax sp.]